MRLPEERVRSAVRFTFGKYNTEEEVLRTVQCVKTVTERIRKGAR